MDGHHESVGLVHEERVSIKTGFVAAGVLSCKVAARGSGLTTPPPRVSNLAEMAAIGLGLPAEMFKDAGRYG